MAMTKYLVSFFIIVILLNVLIFLFAQGVNVFSIIGDWFASLQERYTFFEDPLIPASLITLLIIVVVALVFMRGTTGKA